MEAPRSYNGRGWDELYLYRGAHAAAARPMFTGDVYTDVPVPGDLNERRMRCAVLQHPCSLRLEGVTLVDRALVGEVVQRKIPHTNNWDTAYACMPVPRLDDQPDEVVTRVDGAEFGTCVNFDLLHVVPTSTLRDREACLSRFGVNLLMQRLTKYLTRTTVSTADIDQHTRPVYEEADLCEEWCTELDVSDAASIAAEERLFQDWLHADGGELSQYARLKDPGKVAAVRRDMRNYLQRRNE